MSALLSWALPGGAAAVRPQVRQDIQRMLCQGFRSGLEQLSTVAKAPEGPYRKHTSSVGGFHVDRCVAEIEPRCRLDPEIVRDPERAGGLRLLGYTRLGAQNRR